MSTSASATSVVTSTRRVQRPARPANRRLPARSTDSSSGRAACIAGSMPNASAETSDVAIAKARTRTSTEMVSAAPGGKGASATSVGRARSARPMPARPVSARPSSRFSIRRWRAIAQVLPPRAVPQRDLVAPVAGLGQLQVGHVDAGNQENEADRCQQHAQHGPQIPIEVLAQRTHRNPAHAVAVFELQSPYRLEHDGGRRAALLDRGTGLQSPDHLEVVRPAGAGAIELERRPQPRDVGEAEPGRHHADHGVGLAVQANGAADHDAIAAEAIDPQRMAQDDDLRSPWDVFGRRESAAERGLDAHRPEEARRYARTDDAIGRPAANQVEAAPQPVVGGDRLEGAAFERGQRHELRNRRRVADAIVELAPDLHQMVAESDRRIHPRPAGRRRP